MSKRKKIVALLAGALTGVAALAAGLRRKRVTPEDHERRRRILVATSGKMASGTTTDFADGVISYTYTVGGVEYFATQNLFSLTGLLPPNPETLIARPVTVKYLPANPANSVVLAEEWSGLLFSPQAEQTAGRTN
ncbi:MAG: hypothetical protein ACM3S5_01020 [Rhodospirillales bacterium]